MDLDQLEARIHQAIPLARTMQVTATSADVEHVTLRAPLAPNVNHEGTAFGGSLHAVAVLAGWALVTASVADQAVGYLVIQDSEIAYKHPVRGDFAARATWITPRTRFLDGLSRKKLARAKVVVEVTCAGQTCATLTAHFVAQTGKA